MIDYNGLQNAEEQIKDQIYKILKVGLTGSNYHIFMLYFMKIFKKKNKPIHTISYHMYQLMVQNEVPFIRYPYLLLPSPRDATQSPCRLHLFICSPVCLVHLGISLDLPSSLVSLALLCQKAETEAFQDLHLFVIVQAVHVL